MLEKFPDLFLKQKASASQGLFVGRLSSFPQSVTLDIPGNKVWLPPWQLPNDFKALFILTSLLLMKLWVCAFFFLMLVFQIGCTFKMCLNSILLDEVSGLA